MSDGKKRVCPVERAGCLDNRIRKWLHDPRKILGPYLKEGMVVLDVGCGPGFFSVDIARMVGPSGRVIACDLQEGMLQKLGDKIRGTDLEGRITLHRCAENRIGWAGTVDFVLAFYLVHEIPDQKAFFSEIHSILGPGGRVFIAEPPFHVSKRAFDEMIGKAREACFVPAESPKVRFSRIVVLNKDRT